MVAGCHVRAYLAAAGVDLVAVADPHLAKAERLAGPVGAAAVTGLERLLDLGVDVVSIWTRRTPTPPSASGRSRRTGTCSARSRWQRPWTSAAGSPPRPT